MVPFTAEMFYFLHSRVNPCYMFFFVVVVVLAL